MPCALRKASHAARSFWETSPSATAIATIATYVDTFLWSRCSSSSRFIRSRLRRVASICHERPCIRSARSAAICIRSAASTAGLPSSRTASWNLCASKRTASRVPPAACTVERHCPLPESLPPRDDPSTASGALTDSSGARRPEMRSRTVRVAGGSGGSCQQSPIHSPVASAACSTFNSVSSRTLPSRCRRRGPPSVGPSA
mmetsp:Transcript_57927/g.133071  ORF Transcript_57927/g.133071 Transcript_57927/m.133071 type:complete len:201 (+) Transcript_57927:303-905(+)